MEFAVLVAPTIFIHCGNSKGKARRNTNYQLVKLEGFSGEVVGLCWRSYSAAVYLCFFLFAIFSFFLFYLILLFFLFLLDVVGPCGIRSISGSYSSIFSFVGTAT